MNYSLKLGDKTAAGLGLIVESADIGQPVPRVVSVSVPCRDGEYDFSRQDGRLHFDNRELTYVFALKGTSAQDVSDKLSPVLNAIYDAQTISDGRYIGWSFSNVVCKNVKTERVGYAMNIIRITATFTAAPYMVKDGTTLVNIAQFTPSKSPIQYRFLRTANNLYYNDDTLPYGSADAYSLTPSVSSLDTEPDIDDLTLTFTIPSGAYVYLFLLADTAQNWSIEPVEAGISMDTLRIDSPAHKRSFVIWTAHGGELKLRVFNEGEEFFTSISAATEWAKTAINVGRRPLHTAVMPPAFYPLKLTAPDGFTSVSVDGKMCAADSINLKDGNAVLTVNGAKDHTCTLKFDTREVRL